MVHPGSCAAVAAEVFFCLQVDSFALVSAGVRTLRLREISTGYSNPESAELAAAKALRGVAARILGKNPFALATACRYRGDRRLVRGGHHHADHHHPHAGRQRLARHLAGHGMARDRGDRLRRVKPRGQPPGQTSASLVQE
jgi:hypothetical protein